MWVFSITLAIVVFNLKFLKIKELVIIICSTVGIPFVFRLLWNKHIELVFVKGNSSTHSMSVENYSNIFAGKTQEDIHSISKLFFEATFSWENRIWLIAIVFGILIAMLFFFQKNLLKETQGGVICIYSVIVYLIIVYLIYQYVKFAEYLPKLKNDQYIALITVKDDASVSYNDQMREAMSAIGLQCDLTDKYRSNYAAVIDGGNVVFEELSEEKITYEECYEGLEIKLTSAGFKTENKSEILIDGIDDSLNTRGVNIVIYDKYNKVVCEQITFDTWLMDGLFIN